MYCYCSNHLKKPSCTYSDIIQNKEPISCERYNTVNRLLSEAVNMGVTEAFKIRKAVKQSEGEGITAFSMVYDMVKKQFIIVKIRTFQTYSFQ